MILRRPNPRFAFGHPAHTIALGFGVGMAPIAPGTAGTLLAFPIWWGLAPLLPTPSLLGLIAALFALGIWACELTGRHLGVHDHGAMVWDEVVAFLLVLTVVPDRPSWQIAAFFLFRVFDVVKPPPIRDFERRFHGGFGVMFDDILAAGYTLLVLAFAKKFLFS